MALPNRLIGNLSGPYGGKRHDSTILNETGLLTNLKRSAWYNNLPLCIYGDQAYPLFIHLLPPFSRQNLTPNPVNYNKAMSQARVSVEWLFNERKTYFKFVSSIKAQMKIGLNAVGKLLCMCPISKFKNLFYENHISVFFQLICLDSLTLLFILYCIIRRKYCIQISAYFPTLVNLSSKNSKKSFFKKNETSGILKTSCKFFY